MKPEDLRSLLAAAPSVEPFTCGRPPGKIRIKRRGRQEVWGAGPLAVADFYFYDDARLCATLRNLAPLLVDLWETSEGCYGGQGRSSDFVPKWRKAVEALREAKP